MAKKPTITDRGEVEVEHEGRKYVGQYEIEGRRRVPMITVSYQGRRKKTHVGSSARAIAALLLLELVKER